MSRADVVRELLNRLLSKDWSMSDEEELGWGYAMGLLAAATYADDPVAAALAEIRQAVPGEWRVRIAATHDDHEAHVTNTLICESDDLTLVAYRGTTTFGADLSEDRMAATILGWLDNITSALGRSDYQAAYHWRALATLDDVRRAVAAARERKARVFMSGHSAGGVIALMAARDLTQEFHRVHRVFTYGSPMPGTADFEFSIANVPVTRFELGDDPVPWFPGQYSHVRAPGVAMVGELAGGLFRGTPLPLSWRPVGRLRYLHPPGSAIDPSDRRTPDGYGLTTGESKHLIERRLKTRGRLRDSVKDHHIAAYLAALRALTAQGPR
ncbi:hypothetical protein ACFHYQ_23080 [Sphaerimonospora cavernae]|uniref:Fungal lipase-type domain-containing protein n=1 Tax=Sphaerimonospora cavernae TaxID=1740611 RepID=A0ABV6UAJ1_9ACTN